MQPFRLNKKLARAFLVCSLFCANNALARLEVCNHTDLVQMVAIGYDTFEGRIASEGWWRIYPGFCEVPIDVTFLNGAYYVHAESNPSSTMPGDAFTWGESKPLCVETSAEFRLTDAEFCASENIVLNFDQIGKNWRNVNIVEIKHSQRQYINLFRVRVAGVQRLLSMLGYDVGDIDGVLGEQTVAILNQIGSANQIFGLDFKQVYPVLEQLLVERQKLNN